MKIGILGLGHIARGMADTIVRLPGAEPWAAASRSLEKAENFAREFGFARAYGSYEELYRDPEVELVYIATPHNCHFEQAKAAMGHGKHVLCEKALTVRAAEAEELVRIAGEKQLFLMEAQMLRFMPLAKTLVEILEDGIIGKPISFEASFYYPLEHKERVMRPELGGGALLDIGCYPLTLADMLMGHDYTSVSSEAILTDTGVDATEHILLRAVNGMTASLNISIRGSNYRDGVIHGTEGHLIIRDVNHLSRIEQYDKSGQWIRNWEKPGQISDYAHELDAAIKSVREGKTQCDEYPWETMLAHMRLMDGLRKQWGVAGT